MNQAMLFFCITGFLTCSDTISWKYSKFITHLLLCEGEWIICFLKWQVCSVEETILSH